MHFRPLHDRVVVRRIDAGEKTAGELITTEALVADKPKKSEGTPAVPIDF